MHLTTDNFGIYIYTNLSFGSHSFDTYCSVAINYINLEYFHCTSFPQGHSHINNAYNLQMYQFLCVKIALHPNISASFKSGCSTLAFVDSSIHYCGLLFIAGLYGSTCLSVYLLFPFVPFVDV